ncbi:MAG: hypothetical protein ACI8XV_000555 [Arenicella sp.]|jgi:hypothetical protein
MVTRSSTLPNYFGCFALIRIFSCLGAVEFAITATIKRNLLSDLNSINICAMSHKKQPISFKLSAKIEIVRTHDLSRYLSGL